MYLSRKSSKAPLKEKVTRRELFKMGLITAGGLLVAKSVSPFAKSASAQVKTGMPPSSLRARAGSTKRVAWRTRVTVIEG